MDAVIELAEVIPVLLIIGVLMWLIWKFIEK